MVGMEQILDRLVQSIRALDPVIGIGAVGAVVVLVMVLNRGARLRGEAEAPIARFSEFTRLQFMRAITSLPDAQGTWALRCGIAPDAPRADRLDRPSATRRSAKSSSVGELAGFLGRLPVPSSSRTRRA